MFLYLLQVETRPINPNGLLMKHLVFYMTGITLLMQWLVPISFIFLLDYSFPPAACDAFWQNFPAGPSRLQH
jgi:hypothetical protein